MKLVTDVSGKFEPGAESIGDFVLRAAVELTKIGQMCSTPEYDGRLEMAVADSKAELVEVEGEF